MKMSKAESEAAMAQILKALAPLGARGGNVEAYRKDPYSIYVRVVSPAFAKVERTARHGVVFEHLRALPDRVVGEIGFLVPVTPAEMKTSGSSLTFDDERPKARKKPKAPASRRAALRRAS